MVNRRLLSAYCSKISVVVRKSFYSDPDPTFYFVADLFPDPTFYFDADPDLDPTFCFEALDSDPDPAKLCRPTRIRIQVHNTSVKSKSKVQIMEKK
jgi:hypothetical protein